MDSETHINPHKRLALDQGYVDEACPQEPEVCDSCVHLGQLFRRIATPDSQSLYALKQLFFHIHPQEALPNAHDNDVQGRVIWQIGEKKCKACDLLSDLWYEIDSPSRLVYYLITELFVKLHNGKDVCEP